MHIPYPTLCFPPTFNLANSPPISPEKPRAKEDKNGLKTGTSLNYPTLDNLQNPKSRFKLNSKI